MASQTLGAQLVVVVVVAVAVAVVVVVVLLPLLQRVQDGRELRVEVVQFERVGEGVGPDAPNAPWR